MESWIKIVEKVKLKNPLLIEGLPGIGNVGRVAAGYLVNELKMTKFAELYSPYFLPLVIVHEDAEAHVLNCEFYYKKAKDRDIVVVTGDTQSITPEGHYEISMKIIDFAQSIGVKEIITLGGFIEGQGEKNGHVIGVVNDKKLLKKYKNPSIDFAKQHHIATIVGASGLILGLSKTKDIDALCLLGETPGAPVLTDPIAADNVLRTLSKIIGIKVDLKRLEKSIAELNEKIRNVESLHRRTMEQLSPKDEQVRYIG
ncbi:MAG TPA: proteasome assembly chaperone family protein [archaeon]|nr:proteasome assembly chaperone family protein [archaeon]